MRSEHGTIVHTGDWKIDETPVDGLEFDRTTFEKLGNLNILMKEVTRKYDGGV